jgi:hypothetical protein
VASGEDESFVLMHLLFQLFSEITISFIFEERVGKVGESLSV